jgi:hypothetical protein
MSETKNKLWWNPKITTTVVILFKSSVERKSMKANKLLISFLFLSVFLTGCTVGRYVTNVTSSGPNKVAVEKCTTKAYGNFYWNEECSETTLTLQPSSGSK